MFTLIWSGLACAGAILLVVGLVYAAQAGNGDREAEQSAREFFTEHGHWPDERPGTPPARG